MEEQSVSRHIEHQSGSVRSYSLGFGLSIFFTAMAFWLVSLHSLSGARLMVGLFSLALIQFIVQLTFFLHVGHETKPRWKQLVLLLMIVVVLILVLGSIWVMYSLNYRMTPDQINSYMLKQDGGI